KPCLTVPIRARFCLAGINRNNYLERGPIFRDVGAGGSNPLSDHSFLPLADVEIPASATQTRQAVAFPVWAPVTGPVGRSANSCSPGRRRKNRKTCRRYRPTVHASGPR